jgi:hypothetical protein
MFLGIRRGMNMTRIDERWRHVRQLLVAALADLADVDATVLSTNVPDGQLRGTLEEFGAFLEHNEFELAWDALADLGSRRTASAAFWSSLARAAAIMGLADKETEARQWESTT